MAHHGTDDIATEEPGPAAGPAAELPAETEPQAESSTEQVVPAAPEVIAPQASAAEPGPGQVRCAKCQDIRPARFTALCSICHVSYCSSTCFTGHPDGVKA